MRCVDNRFLFSLVFEAFLIIVLRGSYLVSVTSITIEGETFIAVLFPAKSDFTQLRLPRYALS